jgi:hypothetical protein
MSVELVDRTLVACRVCGWVHYLMTAAEKRAHDQSIARYELSVGEREAYELEFRQCLRCETPSEMFRIATPQETDQAFNHMVTPVLVGDPLDDV